MTLPCTCVTQRVYVGPVWIQAACLCRFAVVGGIQRLEDRRAIDYREDFFGKAAFLTVRQPCEHAEIASQVSQMSALIKHVLKRIGSRSE